MVLPFCSLGEDNMVGWINWNKLSRIIVSVPALLSFCNTLSDADELDEINSDVFFI